MKSSERISEETVMRQKHVNNIYRTRKYIVCQSIGFTRCNNTSFNATISTDTFYLRTPERDREYELLTIDYPYADGKRIPTTMSIRKYVQ